MKAVFVELPAFERFRSDYLDDDGFRALQSELMKSPENQETSFRIPEDCESCDFPTPDAAKDSVVD